MMKIFELSILMFLLFCSCYTTRSSERICENSTNCRSIKDIKSILSHHIKPIRSIYNTAIKTDKNIRGKVVLNFTILPNGSITNLSIAHSDIKDAIFQQEVVSYVKKMQFPISDTTVTIDWPLIFSFSAFD